MVSACRVLGADIYEEGTTLIIKGVAGVPKVSSGIIECGNSGQVLRFIPSLIALTDTGVEITGDESIRQLRPVQPLMDGLAQFGATCVSLERKGHAPFMVKGPIFANNIEIDGEDSQPVSALLMAAAFMEGTSEIKVRNPGELPWVNLTLSWFEKLGFSYINNNFETYKVKGGFIPKAFNYCVPGDFSSLAYPLVAALITGAGLTITNVDMADPQGDKYLIGALGKMGAGITYNGTNKSLTLKPTSKLKGVDLDINSYIDALPILAVAACYAHGETILRNCAIARKKECDRLSSISIELGKMGAEIIEEDDLLRIMGRPLKGADCLSHKDHRIAMALTIAGLGAKGETNIVDVGCINKSYPGFLQDMAALGAKVGTQL